MSRYLFCITVMIIGAPILLIGFVFLAVCILLYLIIDMIFGW